MSDGARLVVDYGSTRDLILLAIYNVKTLEELPYDQIKEFGNKHSFPVVTRYDMPLDEAIALQKTLPANREGFVIRYSNGFRIKIKGEEYTRISRIINSLTPLNVWENLVNGELCVSFYYNIPEEFHNEIKIIATKLKNKYNKILEEINKDQEKLPKCLGNLVEHRKYEYKWFYMDL
jgi:RNA ligase